MQDLHFVRRYNWLRMKACLICPMPDLDLFVDRQATTHLTLVHLVAMGPEYADFYHGRSRDGDYIIVDNGAKELNTGFNMSNVLAAAHIMEAHEVVLTDVRYECDATIQKGKTELEWLRTFEGRVAYERAGCPKLMIVPQGDTVLEWTSCLLALLEYVGIAREDIDTMPEPSVGFAYHYDHLFEGGLPYLLHNAKIETLDIHMLGWPRRLETLREIAETYPSVRSVDSGRPFSYAVKGKETVPGVDNPGRDKDFFSESIPIEHVDLAFQNIATFRSFAGDK